MSGEVRDHIRGAEEMVEPSHTVTHEPHHNGHEIKMVMPSHTPADPDLAALDALYQAATPGEWAHSETQWVSAAPWRDDLLPGPAMVCVTNGNDPRREANAALIAALHNAWPELRVAVAVANTALAVEDTWNAYEATDKLGVREATDAAKKYEAACETLDAARARLRALREGGQ